MFVYYVLQLKLYIVIVLENNFGKTLIKYGKDTCKQGFRRRETAFSSFTVRVNVMKNRFNVETPKFPRLLRLSPSSYPFQVGMDGVQSLITPDTKIKYTSQRLWHSNIQ